MSVKDHFRTFLAVSIGLLASTSVVQAQYSGGTGEPNDPYQIATAADLIALGETPDDYDKHFVLTADIDLDPNLPGGRVFDRAVIASGTYISTGTGFTGTLFTGDFDGNGHTILNLTIDVRTGNAWPFGETSNAGLFGQTGDGANISNLCMEAVDVTGSRFVGGLVGFNHGSITGSCSTGSINALSWYVGGLVGFNHGSESSIIASYSTCVINGNQYVGGLVGENSGNIIACHSTGTISGIENVGGLVGFIEKENITASYSSATVTGNKNIGGLIGENWGGSVTTCYSTGSVVGITEVGGLVGSNRSIVTSSFCTGTVSAENSVGGLIGVNSGSISDAYSTGSVSGDSSVGGLVGSNQRGSGRGSHTGSISSSFWDVENSGLSTSDGGTGLTTAEMQIASTFLEAGWDFVGETENGPNDVWKIVEGQTYPLLSWQKYGGGTGEPNDPYLIYTAEHLNALGAEPNDYDKHFKLRADIDLSDCEYDRAVIAPDVNEVEGGFQGHPFTGMFDGSGYMISHLTITGGSGLGLFGKTGNGATISNLGMEGADVNATGDDVGGLVGWNSGRITSCYSTGHIISGGNAMGGGGWSIGGLVGDNDGLISNCHNTGAVSGQNSIGGLVGFNYDGTITSSYSTGSVTGLGHTNVFCSAGGLAGENYWGTISNCYSNSSVSGNLSAGGLVGDNGGTISNCYSNGLVSVHDQIEPGGLVGMGGGGMNSFWDIETSGQTTSAGGGTGLTTSEMQTATTFLEAGWDFMDETENGTEDIWKIAEGLDYPRLWWEQYDGQVTLELSQRFTVTLESNPSTGYRWEWVDSQDSILEQIGEAEFKPRETGDPPLVGAGGWDIFTFEAVSPGQMTLKLVYRRSWEEGVEPLKTFSLQVVVP